MKCSAHVLALIVFLVMAATTLTGCMSSPGMTSQDINRRHINAVKQNYLMIQDDLDVIFMIDRPSKLTPYTIR